MDQNIATAYLGLFEYLKALLFSEEFKERYRQKPQYFTRQRSLIFSIVIIFLLNLIKRALQDELDEFFKLLEGADVAVRMVSKSAFVQARQKLKYEAFVELNQAQVSYYYDHFDVALWYGLRLVVFYKLKSAQFIIEKVPTLKIATLKLLLKRGPLYYRKGAHFCSPQRTGDKISIAQRRIGQC